MKPRRTAGQQLETRLSAVYDEISALRSEINSYKRRLRECYGRIRLAAQRARQEAKGFVGEFEQGGTGQRYKTLVVRQLGALLSQYHAHRTTQRRIEGARDVISFIRGRISEKQRAQAIREIAALRRQTEMLRLELHYQGPGRARRAGDAARLEALRSAALEGRDAHGRLSARRRENERTMRRLDEEIGANELRMRHVQRQIYLQHAVADLEACAAAFCARAPGCSADGRGPPQ